MGVDHFMDNLSTTNWTGSDTPILFPELAKKFIHYIERSNNIYITDYNIIREEVRTIKIEDVY